MSDTIILILWTTECQSPLIRLVISGPTLGSGAHYTQKLGGIGSRKLGYHAKDLASSMTVHVQRSITFIIDRVAGEIIGLVASVHLSVRFSVSALTVEPFDL